MIETERLILRRWKESDLEPFAAINRDPKVMATLGALRTLDETKAFIGRIQKGFEDNGYGLYATEVKETGEMIGYVGCIHLPPDMPITPRLEIGWRLSSAHWGRGLCT
jgi:RimJ/RimL family protein N-acetyltransferase